MALNDRAALVVGSTLAAVGVASSVTLSEHAGAAFLIVGMLLGIVGLHRFGRRGADEWPPNPPQSERE